MRGWVPEVLCPWVINGHHLSFDGRVNIWPKLGRTISPLAEAASGGEWGPTVADSGEGAGRRGTEGGARLKKIVIWKLEV